MSIGQQFTVEAQATDTGGVVAAVEVSTDYGDTWHPMDQVEDKWIYSFEVRYFPFL